MSKSAKISDLIFDDKNMNKHTQFGMHILEKSISELGLGRSILLDRNNRIIAGNGVTETAGQLGIEDVVIVETTGDRIVAVKRLDVDLDSIEGRKLALADNASAKANIDWDDENIKAISEKWDIKPEEWGVSTEFDEVDEEEGDGLDEKKAISTKMEVECEDVSKLAELFSELQERGFKVKLV